jgi:RNA polymerase sigma-70 factor (ECF subfamily)
MTGFGRTEFESWYLAAHPRLLSSLLVVAGSRDIASDVTDEAFARALARWDRVGTMESPAAWTYAVALNVLRRRFRRASLERALLRRTAQSTVQPAPEGEIWDLVRSLPIRQRTAIVLRYIADFTENQIAAVMGVTRGTVASCLSDARRSLGESLRDEPSTAKERMWRN